MGCVRHARAWSSAALLLGLVAATASFEEAIAAGPYDGHAVVRVHVDRADAVRKLEALALDILDDRPTPPALLARVRPEQWPMLDASGIGYEIVVSDLQLHVDAEAARLAGRPPAAEAFFTEFRTLEEIDARLASLAGDHPDWVELFDIGPSLEQRPILGIRIASGGGKPALLVTAGQHAREWIATMSGICVAESFVTRAHEPAIAQLLEHVEIIVVPVVNPDGYVYSWEVERLWRKNRRDEFGVDLNRNFGYGWGGPGSSGNPFAGNYRGEAAFSEPEAVGVRDLVVDTPRIFSHVDLHSFGQLVLYPWGHLEEPAPADATLAEVANDLADALGAPHAAPHVALQGVFLYPAAGNISDWMYGERDVYSFIFELRPDEVEDFATGFLLPPDEIAIACDETMQAIEHLAAWTIEHAPKQPDEDGTTSTTDTGEDAGEGTAASETTTSGEPPTEETTASPGDATGSDSGDPSATDTSDEGCGCRATPPPAPAWMLLGLLLARRRRHHASSPHD